MNSTTNTLKFFWNGIKANGGKLQKCRFDAGELRSFQKGTITIYAKQNTQFSAEVRKAFTVFNDSDMQTDYFVNDLIRVVPTHPLYAQVLTACKASDAHYDKRFAA